MSIVAIKNRLCRTRINKKYSNTIANRLKGRFAEWGQHPKTNRSLQLSFCLIFRSLKKQELIAGKRHEVRRRSCIVSIVFK